MRDSKRVRISGAGGSETAVISGQRTVGVRGTENGARLWPSSRVASVLVSGWGGCHPRGECCRLRPCGASQLGV